MPSLGQIAYTAYADAVNWRSFHGDMLQEWDAMPHSLRMAWDAAASAALREGTDRATREREMREGV